MLVRPATPDDVRFDKMGVKQIRLDTAAVNEAARRLFASCGFRVSTIEMLIDVETVQYGLYIRQRTS